MLQWSMQFGRKADYAIKNQTYDKSELGISATINQLCIGNLINVSNSGIERRGIIWRRDGFLLIL